MDSPSNFQLILQRLQALRGGQFGQPPQGPPPAPPMPAPQGPGRDINLPNQSGQIDPRLPMAHLPPAVRAALLQQMMSGKGQP